MDFEKGEVVYLKSGGPPMTIENVGQAGMTGEDTVWCVWFETVGSKQMVKRETFSPVALKKKEAWTRSKQSDSASFF